MELTGPEIPVKELSREEIEVRYCKFLDKIATGYKNTIKVLKERTIIIDKDLPFNCIKNKVKKILVEKEITHDVMIVNKISKEIKSKGFYFIPKSKEIEC